MLVNDALKGHGRLAIHLLLHQEGRDEPRRPVERRVRLDLLCVRCKEGGQWVTLVRCLDVFNWVRLLSVDRHQALGCLVVGLEHRGQADDHAVVRGELRVDSVHDLADVL